MNLNLWKEYKIWTQECKFVDLTHTLSPETPHWSGFMPMDSKNIFNYNDGFNVHEVKVVTQYGTHIDAPAHFVEGKRFLDKIEPKEMILPLCILDISEKVKNNSDYSITVKDLEDWENKYGKIPENSFVALRTDWYLKKDLDNRDSNGNKHYPGWSMDVLKILIEDRNVTAVGHETSDTDPAIEGAKNGLIMEYYVLEQDIYQIELMKNLDQIPPKGALIFCGFPKYKDGPGFPARCIALCPID
ncbi:kynurenine formamidase [Bisgaardia hudsonensis]|uniref:Kynurenine formamidase n=1 Tax=Bisgaardia hudsonensis TaxID=109472 RepID=A0A4R2N1D7_9PAST|nr:cyclase family protein [Bisgaardia hudsonensis]QLB13083.1 cyclase [Bisgaardia hudsonensis]TCP13350.1 kynurenine formamidase [Bisgaardia hudsonensis]